MKKSKINYLLTIPKSSKYPVCETYLEFLVDFMEVLELRICKRRLTVVRQDLIYLHSKIIPNMGGFHQLHVFRKFFSNVTTVWV